MSLEKVQVIADALSKNLVLTLYEKKVAVVRVNYLGRSTTIILAGEERSV
jgi:hypothetical protein